MDKAADSDEKKARPSAIELRVDEISQLFNNLDPFPFRERDLDKSAEDFIVGWARELPRRAAIQLIVHLPQSEAATHRAAVLPEALTGYFNYRTEETAHELKELFRVGRRSLLIGLCALAICLLLGQIINGRLGTSYAARFLEESLVILGWVANWKPIEVFLYDWLPIKRRLDLYRRLSRASVQIEPYEGVLSLGQR